jgi:hypothetical protein
MSDQTVIRTLIWILTIVVQIAAVFIAAAFSPDSLAGWTIIYILLMIPLLFAIQMWNNNWSKA